MRATTTMLATLAFLLAGLQVNAQSGDAARESEAEEIETLLIAPCCWRQPVSDHQSEIAIQMRGEVRQMLQAGMGRQEILDSYVEQYGTRILSIPPQQGFGRLSFLMPVGFVLVGLFVVIAVMRRFRASAPRPTTDSSEGVTRRIEEELDALDER